MTPHHDCCSRRGDRLTPEEKAVLAHVEATGHIHADGLTATQAAEATIWLEHLGLIHIEPLPDGRQPRRVWIGYAARLGLQLPRRADVPTIRRIIDHRRLWTVHQPAAAQAA